MSDNSLNITLKNPSTEQTSLWVRIEQEDYTPDTPTKAEIEAIVDSAFELTPCTDPEALTGGMETEPAPSIEDEIEKAQAVLASISSGLGIPTCNEIVDGTFTTQIRVYRSHVCKDYALRLTNGTIGAKKTVKETVSTLIEVNGDSHTLDLPVSCKECDPIGKYCLEPVEVTCDHPISSILGSTLNFSEDVGTIAIEYETEYDLVEITVPGNGETVGSCQAFCVFEGMTVDIKIEPPDTDEDDTPTCLDPAWYVVPGDKPMPCKKDPDTGEMVGDCCTERVYVEERCVCTDDVDHYYYKEKETTCPKGVDPGSNIDSDKEERLYKWCGGDGTDVGKNEFYLEKCCQDWPFNFAMPQCVKKYSVFRGGVGMDLDERQSYIDKYGEGNVQFVGVGTDDGICGTAVVEQVLHANNCCDNVPAIEWDPDYSGSGVPGMKCITGGKGPFTWTLSGFGFSFSSSYTLRRLETNNRCVTVYSEDQCNNGQLQVSDGCGYTMLSLTDDNAEALAYDDANSADLIASYGDVFVTGGAGPFHWSIGGDGFSFDGDGGTEIESGGRGVRVYTTSAACGTASITITDDCGAVTTGRVRSDNGEWVLEHDDRIGDGAETECIAEGYKYIDDWCVSPPSCDIACDADSEQHCPDPYWEGYTNCHVEGYAKWRWTCNN